MQIKEKQGPSTKSRVLISHCVCGGTMEFWSKKYSGVFRTVKDEGPLGTDDSLNIVDYTAGWGGGCQRKVKKKRVTERCTTQTWRHKSEEENNLLLLNSFHFISSHVVLSFFKALLSVLTNKFKYHCILMTDISLPWLSFIGWESFVIQKANET